MSRRLSLILFAIAACNRSDIRSCGDSLAGVWTAADASRWMMLDNGATLEAYPMFDDAVGSGADIAIAPRVMDLRREGQLSGAIQRRYVRRGDTCEARAGVRVTACHDDVIELEHDELSAPVTFAPCTWQAPAPPYVDRWHRD